MVYRFIVSALTYEKRAQQLRQLLKIETKITRIETDISQRLLEIESSEELDLSVLKQRLVPFGFHLQNMNPEITAASAEPQSDPRASSDKERRVIHYCVDGMSCRSCEITVERKWKKIEGVKEVDVNAAKGTARLVLEGREPSLEELQSVLGEEKYRVRQGGKKEITTLETVDRPSFWTLMGLFALVIFIGSILSRWGLFKPNIAIGAGLSFGAIFLIGLVAASSSCISVSGGLLLSAAAKFNERYRSVGGFARMRPVILFVAGRLVGYALLGGILGVIGKALTPSPLVTAFITILAALYMLVMGLDMLKIAPAWLKGIMPRLPKSLSHRVMDAEGREHPAAPFMLGVATFFLPCGFTQALQLYALTTGSFVTSATMLLAFALGTAPALLALGWASSSLKGRAGRWFFRFSGALVVVLGLWNIQNGLAIAGYPIALPSLVSPTQGLAADNKNVPPSLPKGQTQVVKMAVTDYGYQPNRFTVRAGSPVRWEIRMDGGGGCAGAIVSRKIGVQKLLQPGLNVIEFTPKEKGEIAFSCSMGMYRGSFTVL